MAVARDDLGRAARKRGIEGQVTIIRHFGIRCITIMILIGNISYCTAAVIYYGAKKLHGNIFFGFHNPSKAQSTTYQSVNYISIFSSVQLFCTEIHKIYTQ